MHPLASRASPSKLKLTLPQNRLKRRRRRPRKKTLRTLKRRSTDFLRRAQFAKLRNNLLKRSPRLKRLHQRRRRFVSSEKMLALWIK